VQHDRSIQVGANQAEAIGGDETFSVSGNRTKAVDKDEAESMSGTRVSSDGQTWDMGGKLSFDFNYRGNQNQLIAEALGVCPAFEKLAGMPGTTFISNEPAIKVTDA
jgi:hypothetical protein